MGFIDAIQGLLKNYRYTFLFAVLAIFFTLLYALAVPIDQQCRKGVWDIAAFLTAPFNFTCEGNLLTILSPDGFHLFFQNYVLTIIFLAGVEWIYKLERWNYLINFFFSAILATYMTIIYTDLTRGLVSAGLSVIGASAILTLVAGSLHHAKNEKDKLRYVISSLFASVLATGGLILYGSVGLAEHLTGVIFFLVVMLLCSIKPNWVHMKLKSIDARLFKVLS